MRAAMAQSAIGRRRIPFFGSLPVYPVGILSRLVLVASGALGFRDPRGVRILLMLLVTGVASQIGVGAFGQLGCLVMAGRAGRRRRCGLQTSAWDASQNTQNGQTER